MYSSNFKVRDSVITHETLVPSPRVGNYSYQPQCQRGIVIDVGLSREGDLLFEVYIPDAGDIACLYEYEMIMADDDVELTTLDWLTCVVSLGFSPG